MTYTVWLGDRVIGEADLANERVEPRYCSGNFTPAPEYEGLLPTTDSSLQIRDSSGNVVPTDWVTVYDLDADPIQDEEFEFDESLDDDMSAEEDSIEPEDW